jgi:uncharacterized repeat protein (TIGR01451 family)/fimbrial isopeptide formation D2 family protein
MSSHLPRQQASASFFQKEKRSNFYYHYRMTMILGIISHNLFLMPQVVAQTVLAGDPITNQATGSFVDSADGSSKNIESNIVSVTVAEVAGITISNPTVIEPSATTIGAAAAPFQGVADVNTDDIIYFDFVITNIGNDPTQFFIPGKPFQVIGGTFDRTLYGAVQIVQIKNATGAIVPLVGNVSKIDIPAAGANTGDLTVLGIPAGSIPAGGSVTVRIPVKVTGVINTSVRVALGDTGANDNGLGTVNQIYTASATTGADVRTKDNPNNPTLNTPVTGEADGILATSAEKEASRFGLAPIVVVPQVVGFKSAKLTDSNNDTKINPGETVTWTIDYVNTGPVDDVTNFQITDVLPIGVTKSGAVTLSVNGTGQAAPTVNTGYTGTTTTLGITDTLFTTPITLKVGGAIKVAIPVTINSGITGILSNQSSGTATNLPTVGIKTDNVGADTDLPTNIQTSPYSVTVPSGSISQTITTAIDPTKITVEAAVAQTPFICDGRFYQIRAVSNNSELFLINRFNTPFTNTSVASTSSGIVLNGLAYNPQDNFIYALMRGISSTDSSGVQLGKTLYRFGNGSVAHVGDITGLPNGFTPTAADFGPDGTYYVTRAGGSTELYKINIATQTATLITMTQNTGNIGDMAYNPKDNFLYGIGGAGNQILFKINPVTGNVTTTNLSVSDTWGTAFFDPIGTFYGYSNSGKFYRIDIVTGVATELSTAPTASASDGATCQFTSEKIDVVKAAGVVTKINPTTFDVPYTIKVKNTGAFNAPNVQISENLNQTFSTGNPTISIQVAPNATGGLTTNSSFNGIATNGFNLLSGLNSLAAGTSDTITFTARLVYPNLAAVPSTVLNNQVYASTISSTSAPGTPNLGYTFPSNVPVPPPDLLTADISTNGTTLPISANGDIASPTPITLPTSSNPNLLLVKRITAINGNNANGNISLNSYDPETDTSNPSYPYDKNVILSGVTPLNSDKWPDTSWTPLRSSFLLGARNGGTIKPNDTVEYTIYFLSAGTSTANNVLFCDRVPANVTFSPNAFTNTTANPGGVARGISVQLGNTPGYYTNAGDTDDAQYFPPGIEPSTVFPNISCGKNAAGIVLPNDNGAVVVNLRNRTNATGVLVDDQTNGAYGFVRFQGVVK